MSTFTDSTISSETRTHDAAKAASARSSTAKERNGPAGTGPAFHEALAHAKKRASNGQAKGGEKDMGDANVVNALAALDSMNATSAMDAMHGRNAKHASVEMTIASSARRAEDHSQAALTDGRHITDERRIVHQEQRNQAGHDEKALLEKNDAAFDPLDPMTRRAAQAGWAGPRHNANGVDGAGPEGASSASGATGLDDSSANSANAATMTNADRQNDDGNMAPRARVTMDDLLPQLVRRIAWAGDRNSGTVQMELGAGRHAGTTVTVHSDEGRVRVELQGEGPDVADLRQRIDARLKRQGIDVESVT